MCMVHQSWPELGRKLDVQGLGYVPTSGPQVYIYTTTTGGICLHEINAYIRILNNNTFFSIFFFFYHDSTLPLPTFVPSVHVCFPYKQSQAPGYANPYQAICCRICNIPLCLAHSPWLPPRLRVRCAPARQHPTSHCASYYRPSHCVIGSVSTAIVCSKHCKSALSSKKLYI